MIKSKRIYIVNLLMDILPNSGCQKIKAALFRWAGVKVGNDVEFFQGFKIQGIGEVEIGDNVFFGHQSLIIINKGSKVIFENHSGLGTRSVVATGFHPFTPDGERVVSRKGTCCTIRFCRGAGTGTGCLIMPNSELGEMSYVSAGTVVNRKVKPYSMVGQQPTKTYLKEGELKYING